MRTVLLGAVLLGAVPAVVAPVRVATLVPYVADALGRLPAGHAVVVATVRRSLHAPVVPPTVDLGSPHAPSLEALATARPQLVVADRALHGRLRDDLAVGGTEVLLVDADGVDHTLDGLRAVGARVGAAEAMDLLVAQAVAAIGDATVAPPVPTLLLFGTPGAFLVVTPRTWLGDLASRVGLANVGAAAEGPEKHPGYVQLSDEVLAGLRPSLVLLVAHGDPEAIRAAFVQRLDAGGPWAGLRASATRGVHVLPPSLFASNPGLGLAEAARRLHALGAPTP